MRIIKDKNYGLELLRMILCFWVLLFHCLKQNDNIYINNFKKKMFHVPSFFFISFYFLFPVIKERNFKKMKIRLERLSIPYFFWPLLSWSFTNISFLTLKKSRFDRYLPFLELKEQLIIGRKFFGQFWYIFNLLFFSIIFFILSLSFDIKMFMKIVRFLAIISYFLQYSKYNYIYFDNYKDCISHSIGHFVEVFPIAVFAFTLSISEKINSLRAYRNISIFYCTVIIYFIFKYDLFMNIEIYSQTYNYNGLDKCVFSIFAFIGFYLIPFEKFKSIKLKTFIFFIYILIYLYKL